MQIIAFLLALAAVFCFMFAAYGQPVPNPPRRVLHFGWLGLALLTVSWMVQIIILTGSHVVVH
jgi:hypothetical protein